MKGTLVPKRPRRRRRRMVTPLCWGCLHTLAGDVRFTFGQRQLLCSSLTSIVMDDQRTTCVIIRASVSRPVTVRIALD